MGEHGDPGLRGRRAAFAAWAARLGALAGLSLVLAAAAQAQPAAASRPIRMIVPYAAGGPTDVLARLVAQHLGEVVGQTVFVDNRGGGNGVPGTDAIARAVPDGSTIGLSTIGPLAVNPSLMAKVPYDPLTDFTPLVLVGRSVSVLTVHPSVPANTIAEFVALLKASPGKYSYASGGIGTTQHLSGELFANVAGVQLLHVPYKGEGPAQGDLLGGQVHAMFVSSIVGLQHIRAGKLKGVGVTSAQRLPQLPEVPAIAEFFPGFEVTAWFAMVAPAGLPEPVARRLNDALQQVLARPEVVRKLGELGVAPAGGAPGELTALIRSELPKWRDVIRRANIKPE